MKAYFGGFQNRNRSFLLDFREKTRWSHPAGSSGGRLRRPIGRLLHDWNTKVEVNRFYSYTMYPPFYRNVTNTRVFSPTREDNIPWVLLWHAITPPGEWYINDKWYALIKGYWRNNHFHFYITSQISNWPFSIHIKNANHRFKLSIFYFDKFDSGIETLLAGRYNKRWERWIKWI